MNWPRLLLSGSTVGSTLCHFFIQESCKSMETVNSQHLFYQTRKAIPFVERAEGVFIWDENGKQYLDGCSGAMICNIGHGNKRVIAAMHEQAQKAAFAYRTQFENRPAAELARMLAEASAPHLTKVFFVSGGSEAVESAMKLCRQYYYNTGRGNRYQFISRHPSYHGATMGALALTSYAPLEAPFRPMMKAYPKIPAPYCYRCAYNLSYPQCGLQCAKALEQCILEQGPDSIAAFVAEPVGGASTGALPPPPGYFDIIQETCRKYGIMLILDEVMTGYGRTGAMFAYEHWNVEADIVCLSKGMGSGYTPLGAIISTEDIVEVVVGRGSFQHGHTAAGNPTSCAVGLEVIKIMQEENLPGNSWNMGLKLREGLEELARQFPMIGEVRGIGLMQALELVQDPETRKPFPPDYNAFLRLTDDAYDLGLLIYPRRPISGLTGDHVLVAPPLIINEEQIAELLNRLEEALRRTQAKLM